jgi:hypothetical protein
LANTRARLQALHGSVAAVDLHSGPVRGAVATLRFPYRELPSMEVAPGAG